MNTDSDESHATRERNLDQLAADIGDHYFWLIKVLVRAGGWRLIVPWPMLALGSKARRAQSKEHGSAWLTVVAGASMSMGPERLQALSNSFAADSARTIFTAAFLVITMLSLSVALPGQAVIKLVLGRTPLFAAEFVAPTLWAFLWGMIGGTGMMLYSSLGAELRVIAAIVGLYAFAMSINAVLYTIRMYVLGLVLTARSSDTSSTRKGS